MKIKNNWFERNNINAISCTSSIAIIIKLLVENIKFESYEAFNTLICIWINLILFFWLRFTNGCLDDIL